MKAPVIVLAMIAALTDVKGRLKVKRSAFGDNHEDAIDAQIVVLTENLHEAHVHDRHENAAEDEVFHAENEWTAGLEAVKWLHDEEGAIDIAADWEQLAHPKPPAEEKPEETSKPEGTGEQNGDAGLGSVSGNAAPGGAPGNPGAEVDANDAGGSEADGGPGAADAGKLADAAPTADAGAPPPAVG